jgi:hypothetical protein
MTKTVPADPIMLSGMTDCLAIAVENAVCEWGDTLSSFMDKFVASGLEDSFSNQAPFVTTGCTGEELVAKINETVSKTPQEVRLSAPSLSFSKYYWIGYAIALFAAQSGKSVHEIITVIPPGQWERIYPVFHEYGDELLVQKLFGVFNNSCHSS